MAACDGRLESAEALIIVNELGRFGVHANDIDTIVAQSTSMTYSEAISVISSLGVEEKTYVCAYLATIMTSDLDVNSDEITLWRHISELCGLPTMKLMEAVQYMHELDRKEE